MVLGFRKRLFQDFAVLGKMPWETTQPPESSYGNGEWSYDHVTVGAQSHLDSTMFPGFPKRLPEDLAVFLENAPGNHPPSGIVVFIHVHLEVRVGSKTRLDHVFGLSHAVTWRLGGIWGKYRGKPPATELAL